jgi:FtsH-binding integral membrane protein
LIGQILSLVALGFCALGAENDAIWLATGIFVSIVNMFLSLLNIFSSR